MKTSPSALEKSTNKEKKKSSLSQFTVFSFGPKAGRSHCEMAHTQVSTPAATASQEEPLVTGRQ